VFRNVERKSVIKESVSCGNLRWLNWKLSRNEKVWILKEGWKLIKIEWLNRGKKDWGGEGLLKRCKNERVGWWVLGKFLWKKEWGGENEKVGEVKKCRSELRNVGKWWES
jgi:hypothetical protein